MLDDSGSSTESEIPSVTFESITFSDGTTIDLDPADIVVLVGPNNAGKSEVLRELDRVFVRNRQLTVLKSYKIQKVGTKESFEKLTRKHGQIKRGKGSTTLSGYQWSVSLENQDIQQFWPDDIAPFKSMFCLKIPTETRITGSNPANAINFRDEPLQHPIHILIEDDKLEIEISKYFHRAFHDDLVLDHTPAKKISLLVGTRPIPDPKTGEDRLSKTYRDRVYDLTTPLAQQGDGMRSFASVILHLLAPITASILLLDEPEAFLHPPQARLLGEIIATKKSSQAQLFVATHSPDVLQGLVNVASDRLRLVRIQREGNVNPVKELDKELVKKISSDPLMNYSSVMSGVFHQRVIICEGDSDCMFYSSILSLTNVHGESHPDVLFVHAGGKDRMAMLAETLRALGVPVDVVADIDILRNESGLQRIIKALGGNWLNIQPLYRIVKTAVDNSKPGLSIEQIKEGIKSVLDQELPDSEPEKRLHSNIDEIFRSTSPWDAVKQNGESAIPKGDATHQLKKLQELCKDTGLWIVPVGEMEGFCRSIGGHGPAWVQQVIEERDIEKDIEFERARNFVRALWDNRQ